jgi:hypothetical protein
VVCDGILDKVQRTAVAASQMRVRGLRMAAWAAPMVGVAA